MERIVAVPVLWVLLVAALFVGYLTVGISAWLGLGLPFGPPLLLTALWIGRRRW